MMIATCSYSILAEKKHLLVIENGTLRGYKLENASVTQQQSMMPSKSVGCKLSTSHLQTLTIHIVHTTLT